jgi:phenylacetate-CoA ligase
LGKEILENFLHRFQRRKFRYVYGYTNSIVLFARFLQQRGTVLKDVCPTLTRCVVTSEVCTDEDKVIIERALGVPVTREYGASELDVIAIENKNGRWSLNDSNLFVEVISENNEPLVDGAEGRLVITSLFNKAMPFIRYDLGDIGSIRRDSTGGFLTQLSGRVNDTILLPSGKKSPGLTFYYVSRSILEGSGVLKEFIIRQRTMRHFVFEVVSDRPLNDEERREIQNKMDQYLEPGLTFDVNRVEKIVRPASGKIKHFYSEINS